MVRKILLKISGIITEGVGIFLLGFSVLGLLSINAEPIDYATLFALLGIGATGLMLSFVGAVLLFGEEEKKEHQGQE